MSLSSELFLEQREWEENLQHIAPNLPLSKFKPTKSNIIALATQIADQVIDGKVNAIEAAIKLKAMLKVCEEALDKITPSVVSELDKSSGKSKSLDCMVERVETGVKYDYSANQEWVEYSKTIQEASEERKKIEERLKAIPAGKVLVDESTGETLIAPIKTSTTSFKVTLAK